MTIVFMGTPEFAVPSLRRMVSDGHRIAAVVTAQEKPRGRGQKMRPTPVGMTATQLGLPLLQPANLRSSSFHNQLRAFSPDIIVVVAFRILPEEMFGIPSRGIFNLHASLLPKYRGAAPIAWALINGEKETGVTTFLLEKKVDTGGILLQERLTIGPEETAGELQDRLALLGAEVVSRTVKLLGSGIPPATAQDDSLATPAPKITREDCRLDWTEASGRIHNRVRAFSPAPGAWTIVEGNVLKVYRTAMTESSGAKDALPGTVVHVTPDECVVATGDGRLALREVMLEGRKRMPISEFLRGYRMPVGAVMGDVETGK